MLDELYKQSFTLSQDGLGFVQEDRLLDCNDAFVKLFSFSSKEELLQIPFSTLLAVDEEETLKIAKEQNGCSFEWCYTQENSQVSFFEISLKPLQKENDAKFFVTIKDITQRKNSQMRNKKILTRLELAFAGNDDGIWDWDLQNDTLYFSPSWKKMLGFEDNEIEDTLEEWKTRVHPDDLLDALDAIQEYLDGKSEYYENYHRLKHKDGDWIWILDRGRAKFDENGKATRFVGTHTNITKEKNLEQELKDINNTLGDMVYRKTSELRKSNNYLETIFNTVQDGIAIMDLDSNFILVNDSYEKMTAFTKKELYTTSCISLTEPSMTQKSVEALSIVMEKGFYLGFEKVCIINGGQKLPVRMDIVMMPGKSQLLAVVKDLTYEKKMQKEKELHEQHMFQQSRLAQMGEMISMIAHQWRQPLSAIASTAANLSMRLAVSTYDLNKAASQEQCNNYFLKKLSAIEEYVEALTHTIDDFRTFYKPNKKAVEKRLDTILGKSLNIISSSLEHDGIEVLYTANVSSRVKMHDTELMHVVLNLIKNAQDSFKERQIQNPIIKINVQNSLISIEDNAGGIPVGIREKIFDPYFSTKDAKSGTGLGLYMCKMIIEDHHHGEIVVENLDDGVRFVIKLGLK